MGTHATAVALYPNLAYKPDIDFVPIGFSHDRGKQGPFAKGIRPIRESKPSHTAILKWRYFFSYKPLSGNWLMRSARQ
jgi:hypothetical protein